MITRENILDVMQHRPLLQHEWEDYFTHKGKRRGDNIEHFMKNVYPLGGFHQNVDKEDRTRTKTLTKDYASYIDKKVVPKEIMTPVQSLTILAGEKKARIRKALEAKYGKRDSVPFKEQSIHDMQEMKRKHFLEPILTAARYKAQGREHAFVKRFASGVHEDTLGPRANMARLALKISQGLQKQGGGKIKLLGTDRKLSATDMKLRTHSEDKETFRKGETAKLLSNVLHHTDRKFPTTKKASTPEAKVVHNKLRDKIGASMTKYAPSMKDSFTKEHEERFDRENPNFRVRNHSDDEMKKIDAHPKYTFGTFGNRKLNK